MQIAPSEGGVCTARVRLVGGRDFLAPGETPDQRLLCVAARQRARVNRTQLGAIGFTPKMIRVRVRRGELRRCHQGVYAVGPDVRVELAAETEALLAIEAAVLSHFSAGALAGFLQPPRTEVEVMLRAPRYARSRPGIRVHRTVRLSPHDITRRHGLPMTTPARAMLDVADRLTRRELEWALDEALGRHLLSATKIRETVARNPWHAGGPILLALLDPARARGVTKSVEEERLLAEIRRAGLPDPERNVTIGPFSLDLYWPAAKVAVELDSWRWHQGPGAFKRDRRKDAHCRDHDIELHRVTSEMVDDPLPLLVRLARAIYGAGRVA